MIVTFQTQLKGVERGKAGSKVRYGQHVVKVSLDLSPDYKGDAEKDLAHLQSIQADAVAVRAETDAILVAQGHAPCSDEEWAVAFIGDRASKVRTKGVLESLVLTANDLQPQVTWGNSVIINGINFTEHNGSFYLRGRKLSSSIVVKDQDPPAPNKRRLTYVKDALKSVIRTRGKLLTEQYRTYKIDDPHAVVIL
jgi:hypothetical protein